MSDTDRACAVPLIELLRSVPKDFAADYPTQWSEDGRETGHRHVPVGHMMHRAADALARYEQAEMPDERRIDIGFCALAGGSGGEPWDKDLCRCDPGGLETPPYQCEYCAIHDALMAGKEAIAHASRMKVERDEATESLAALMIKHAFATGHGDTHADLLKELDWQLTEDRQRFSDANERAEKAAGKDDEREFTMHDPEGQKYCGFPVDDAAQEEACPR